MLRDLALQEGWPDTYAGDELLSKEALRLDLGEGDSLTFEPGGQIEYSSQPHTDLHKVLNVVGWCKRNWLPISRITRYICCGLASTRGIR